MPSEDHVSPETNGDLSYSKQSKNQIAVSLKQLFTKSNQKSHSDSKSDEQFRKET